jgi:hypothetical protein
MVAAVRAGESRRAVARRFRVALSTVQYWLTRAGGERLDRVDWTDHPSVPHRVRRTEEALEERILAIRRRLREDSILGEYGAVAIRRELLADEASSGSVPTTRTIGRILERRGALDGRRRVRRPPPPPGWYLPDLAARRVELDSFDVIDGLRLQGGLHLDILTGISLHGGLPVAWPEAGMSAAKAVAAFAGHWREVGLPGYAQFDNDTRFIGGNAVPDPIGPVIRPCRWRWAWCRSSRRHARPASRPPSRPSTGAGKRSCGPASGNPTWRRSTSARMSGSRRCGDARRCASRRLRPGRPSP